MTKIFLTDTKIQNPKNAGKELTDTIPNLTIKLNKCGGGAWIFRFIDPENRKQRPKMTLGYYPVLSIDDARKIAIEYNALVKQGINPIKVRDERKWQEEREAITFQEMTERFREYKREDVKDINDPIRRLELYVLPRFGSMPLNKIKLVEWHTALKPLESEHNNTVLKIATTSSQILDYAVNCGLLDANPLATLRKSFRKKKAKHHPAIKPEELPEFLLDLYTSNARYKTRLLVEWQLLTATRANEAARAEWAEIDFKRKIWTIPAEKMKAKETHIVVLSSQALDILQEMAKFTAGNQYVFTGGKGHKSHMNIQTVNDVIKTIKGGKYMNRLKGHGTRAIFSTYLNEIGENKDHVDKCLSHKVGNDVSLAYNHADYVAIRRRLMQLWGDYVQQCKPSPSQIPCLD